MLFGVCCYNWLTTAASAAVASWPPWLSTDSHKNTWPSPPWPQWPEDRMGRSGKWWVWICWLYRLKPPVLDPKNSTKNSRWCRVADEQPEQPPTRRQAAATDDVIAIEKQRRQRLCDRFGKYYRFSTEGKRFKRYIIIRRQPQKIIGYYLYRKSFMLNNFIFYFFNPAS